MLYSPSQGILDRILAKIKLDVPFFETQTLVCPEPLDIPDAANDLQRELQLYVLTPHTALASPGPD